MADSDEAMEEYEAECRFKDDVQKVFGSRAEAFSEHLMELLRVFWEQAQRTLGWKEGDTIENILERFFPEHEFEPAEPLTTVGDEVDNLLAEWLGDD